MIARFTSILALVLLVLLGTPISPVRGQSLSTVYPKLSWSPDGSKVAVGSNFGVSVYTPNFQPLLAMQVQVPISSVQWSHDGSKLLGSGTDGVIRIWNALTGAVTDTFIIGIQIRSSVSWNPNGTEIAVGSSDHILRIWNISTKAEIATISTQDEIEAVRWSPNGQYIAIGGGHYDASLTPSSFVQIIDTSSWQIVKTINSALLYIPVLDLKWNQSSSRLIIANAQPFIIDVSSGQSVITFEEHLGDVVSVDWSFATNNVLTTSPGEPSTYSWNPNTGVAIKRFEVDENLFSIAWSPDGVYVAGVSIDGTAILWDSMGQQLKSIELPQPQPTSTPTSTNTATANYILRNADEKIGKASSHAGLIDSYPELATIPTDLTDLYRKLKPAQMLYGNGSGAGVPLAVREWKSAVSGPANQVLVDTLSILAQEIKAAK